MAKNIPIEPNDVDRRIWEEELEGFVPQCVFDVHTHVFRWKFNTDPEKDTGVFAMIGRTFPEASWAELNACDAALMPGREVHRLAFPSPFFPSCDFEASNEYVAAEVRGDPPSAALMIVEPSMTAEYLDQQVEEHGFLGFKPYRFYSTTGDPVQCRITDFFPEHQIEVAHRRGLLIMMHLARRDAIGDPRNIDDLLRFSGQYPGAKWILAHCARSYSAWAIERSAGRLRGLPNVWAETSSVCESDAIEALCASIGPGRVMYGSDDLPAGVMRGKYIAFAYAWDFLSEENHSMNLSHCDRRMTFSRYEQLRAMRRASMRLGLTQGQIEDQFCNTAVGLIKSVRDGAG